MSGSVTEPVGAHRWRLLARLAWRESRTTRRRLLLYMSSIALGVGALVAIDSFAGNVTSSVHESSRSLLGGDLAITGRAPLSGAAAITADSLAKAGARTARVTTFPSMATLARSGRTRLAQVRAVSQAYPLVGRVATEPVTAWAELQAGANTVVDPSLLATLDAQVGDSITLGYSRFKIVGGVRAVPGDAGISAAIGPRVFIPDRDLAATRLLVFGSRADYKTLLVLPRAAAPVNEQWVSRQRARLAPEHWRIQTAADAEANLTNAVQRLSEFLGVVGVVALLLGGIGVASGVTAFVARKIDAAAILRCVGATEAQVLLIYVSQAAAMGGIGAAFGASLGVAIQFLLPFALRDFLPVDVSIRVVPRAIAMGLLIGLWVALLFALRPLLRLRTISPLQALRRDVDVAPPSSRNAVDTGLRWLRRRRDPAAWTVAAAIAATVAAIAVARAPTVRIGLGTALGIGFVLATLWVAASALSMAARRVLRAGWPYVIRQGVANLYRPANQTRAVILSLGFGAFLISTLYLVQSALLHEFRATTAASRANLLFFDVQEDQAAGVDSLVRQAGYAVIQRTPIVTMRIAAINGAPVSALVARDARADTTEEAETRAQTNRRPGTAGTTSPRRAGWALRREYRSTFRDTLVSSERITAGTWPGKVARDSVATVSVEEGVARELGVGVGDRVSWDVQGVPIETRVASLRDVDWGRFEPNFFAVFSTGALERAPKQYVVLTNVPNPSATGRLQRQVVDRYPNVSSIDLSLIRDTVNGILRKVTIAIRFLAVFSLAMGVPVLFTAVAATRRERVKEGVLLKTLGATRAQVGRIMVAEYAVLGILGSLTGMALSFVGAWALIHFVFETPFSPAFAPVAGIAAAMAALTIGIGVAGGRDVFSETPLAMLRAE